MIRAALALSAAATLVAVLSVSAPAGVGSRPVITMADSGKTFTLRNRQSATLRLTERYRWQRPKIAGSAVRLVPVNYIRDPGYLEWQVRASAAGTTRITAVGYREGTRPCDPGPCSPRLFRVTIVVR